MDTHTLRRAYGQAHDIGTAEVMRRAIGEHSMDRAANDAGRGRLVGLDGVAGIAWKAAAVVLGLAVLVMYFAGKSERSVDISNVEYGERWPWPNQSSATLHCRMIVDQRGEKLPVVLITMGGEVYGLSGLAIQTSGWPDSRRLMERGDDGAYLDGARKDIIERGKKLCGAAAG